MIMHRWMDTKLDYFLIGDSGSGVTAMMNGKVVLLGIVSFGVEQCEGGFPPGFTRVTSYLEWIYTNADIWIY